MRYSWALSACWRYLRYLFQIFEMFDILVSTVNLFEGCGKGDSPVVGVTANARVRWRQQEKSSREKSQQCAENQFLIKLVLVI